MSDSKTADEPFQYNDMSADFDAAARRNLQCNVLRAVDRPKSTQIFLRFPSQVSFADWLATVKPSRADADDAVLYNVLFTVEGLKLLGLEPQTLQMDLAFQRGARHPDTSTKLGESLTTDTWQGHQQTWHAALLIWHDSDLEPHLPEGCQLAVEHGAGIKQDGSLIQSRGELSFGHFGVLDGISKLVYTEEDYRALSDKPAAAWRWDPRQKLSTLLVPDPFAESSSAFGSYFVFRKYEQDLAEFNRRIDEIEAEIERRRASSTHDGRGVLSPEQRGFKAFEGVGPGALLKELIKQWIFGRTSTGESAFGPGNNFTFDDDNAGLQCPFHAHMRKMNPRGQTGDMAFERTKMFARRGTSYIKSTFREAPGESKSETAKGAKGLLFWSAQASIADQFEFTMERWSNGKNNDSKHLPTPDLDSVIAHRDLDERVHAGWNLWKSSTEIDFTIWSAVKLVGADYLYAPSLEGFEAMQRAVQSTQPTAAIPRTLLSLLYHTQVSPYREEVHQSSVEAAKRFALDDATFAQLGQPSVPTALNVLEAIRETAQAAFKLRSRIEAAQDEMYEATHKLFGLLATLLAAEIAAGQYRVESHELPKEPVTAPGLDRLYHLVYSRRFRDTTAFASEPSWAELHAALQGSIGAASFEKLLPHTRAVCTQIADRYALSLWPTVW